MQWMGCGGRVDLSTVATSGARQWPDDTPHPGQPPSKAEGGLARCRNVLSRS